MTHTKDSEGWEKEFDDLFGWVKPLTLKLSLKSFIRTLLAQREAEVWERIEAQRRKPNDKIYKTDDGGISNYDGPAYYFNKGLDAALATLSDKPSV